MKPQQRLPICFYHKIARKSSEKEFEKFLENEGLIRRFGGADKIKLNHISICLKTPGFV